MSFEEIAKMIQENFREVCISPPRGSLHFLTDFPIVQGCSEVTHVLALLKGVYGFKDAPQAWRIKLDIVLKKLGAKPMNSDLCLCMWHHSHGNHTAMHDSDDLKMGWKRYRSEKSHHRP